MSRDTITEAYAELFAVLRPGTSRDELRAALEQARGKVSDATLDERADAAAQAFAEYEQPPLPPAPVPEYMAENIRRAIEIGGRANGVDLLWVVAEVLRGRMEPSPDLADWFGQAVDAIGYGAPADGAFMTKRRKGADPLATRLKHMDRDTEILRRVDEARAQGYPTAPNTRKESCFDHVANAMNLPEDTVRKVYYRFKTIEHESWEPPPSEH